MSFHAAQNPAVDGINHPHIAIVAAQSVDDQRIVRALGATLGANTENYHHAHEYVESFINKKASENLVNLYYYGAANTAIDINNIENQTLVDSLRLDDPQAIASDDVHLARYMPNLDAVELAWQEVVAS